MKKLIFAAAAAASLVASPAIAANVYDISDIGSPFSYAQYDNGVFTAFTAGCPDRPTLPMCYQGPQGASASQVIYDGNTVLVAHPGTSSANSTAVLFTAPTSSTYRIVGSATLADTRPEAAGGDGVTLTGYFNGLLVGSTALVGPGNSLSYPSTDIFLSAGQQIGLIIGPNGNNSFDSVALMGSISAVPEPGTWALMILGIGMVGATMRRRVRQTAKISFA